MFNQRVSIMVVSVFDVFNQVDYTYLTISRGGVAGNTITSQISAKGVFKLSTGFLRGVQEQKQADARLHIKPSESFADDDLIGQGIRVNNQDYVIVSQTRGDNRHVGITEHYTLTLQETDWSDYAS